MKKNKKSDKIQRAKSSTKEKIIISIFSVVIVISLLGVGAAFALNSRVLKNTDVNSGDDGLVDSDIVTPPEVKEKCVNVLVAGIDYLEGTTRGKLTDVIMLVSFDIEAKKVNVLQIPRDTYIGEDYPTGKINAIYGRSENGGIEGLVRRVNKTLNVTIDHYVTLDMDGFKSIVDKIGGVEVDVPKTLNMGDMIIKKGVQVLDGAHAERFVRERHSYKNQDLGRIEMQQVFMKALINKIFAMPKTKVASLAPIIIKDVTTDLTLSQMLGYYNELVKVDTGSSINFHVIPIVGARGNTILSIKKYETADLLNTYFRPYTSKQTADQLGVLELVPTYENQ